MTKYYVDLWAGADVSVLTLVTEPGPKMEGAVRVCIDLELPDITDPDWKMKATAKVDDGEPDPLPS